MSENIEFIHVITIILFFCAAASLINMLSNAHEQNKRYKQEKLRRFIEKRSHTHGTYCVSYPEYVDPAAPVERGKRSYMISGYIPADDTAADHSMLGEEYPKCVK